MRKIVILIITLVSCCLSSFGAKTVQNPVIGLAERISPGCSKHFRFEIEDELCENDYFSLASEGSKIKICGNNWISVATGFNWYLKYYAKVNITWGHPKQTIVSFPKVAEPIRRETSCLIRYYFSYNTFTYSTPFWNWDRWQQEIDFMALHGVNVALSLTASQGVWYNLLQKFGYSPSEIKHVIGGATHQPQFLQGIIEGGADSLSLDWFERQATLAKRIFEEYNKWGISPVLPGFSGIVPSDFTERTGIRTKSLGVLGERNRPSIIDPADPDFKKVASAYYDELHLLFGKSRYYSTDLQNVEFNTLGMDISRLGREIFNCMRQASEESIWITSRPEISMIDGLPAGQVIALDEISESRPKWGDPESPDYSKNGYIYHDWIFCQKINYGGRQGFYGKMQRLINSFYSTQRDVNGRNLKGIGATMDAVENNHVMWELLFELPWRKNTFLADDWLKQFIKARYGHLPESVLEAWNIILSNMYTPAPSSLQEGPTESVICSRPALSVEKVSKNGTTECYYLKEKIRTALSLLLEESEKLKYSDNYLIDVQEIARTVNADYAQEILEDIEKAFEKGDTNAFTTSTSKFLHVISLQENLMNCRKETMVGYWIESSMAAGTSYDESNSLRREARRLITTWSEDRSISNNEGMHDYANREWGGLITDFHYERWLAYFNYLSKYHKLPIGYDYFDMENDWVNARNPYSFTPSATSYNMARIILKNINNK